MNKLICALLLALGMSLSAHAAIDTYEFQNKAEQERYRNLVEQLRCPKCQNQNIADSDAEISLDMRDLTYEMMFKQDRSDEEIVQHLVERYGDFVRYKPPVDKRTLFLWYSPIVLLVLALLSLGVLVLRRRKVVTSAQAGGGLTDAEQQRIAELLQQTRETKE